MRAAISMCLGIAASILFCQELPAQVPGIPSGSQINVQQNLQYQQQAIQSAVSTSMTAHRSYLENNPSSRQSVGRGAGWRLNVAMAGNGFGMNGRPAGFGLVPRENRIYVRNQTGEAVWVEVSGEGYYKRIRLSRAQTRGFVVPDGAYSVTYVDVATGGTVTGDHSVSVFGGKTIIWLY